MTSDTLGGASADSSRLKIAAQKSGRLADSSFDLLERCGLKFVRSKDKLFCYGRNMPIDLLLVRDDDIPELLMDGVCDLGIVGQNVAEEAQLERKLLGQNSALESVRELGFGGCRLSLAVPEGRPYETASDLNGLRVATSYPQLTARFLAAQDVAANIVKLSGSVEIAPSLGTADAIADLVSTGSTLRANHLKEAEVFFPLAGGAVSRRDRARRAKTANSAALIVTNRRRVAGQREQVRHAARTARALAGDSADFARRRKSNHFAAGRRRQSGGGACGLSRDGLLGASGRATRGRRIGDFGVAGREDAGMKTLQWSALDEAQRDTALARPTQLQSTEQRAAVQRIIDQVRTDGDGALRALTRRYDGITLTDIQVDQASLVQAEQGLAPALAAAIAQARRNIETFHRATMTDDVRIETMPGVICERHSRPIAKVGLYVPAGSAPLPSTVLMLGIPAALAGCAQVVLCSPAGQLGEIDATTLAAARQLGIEQVYRVGGAQAIAAMAYGTESIPKCDKVFGPGNSWVTTAKQLVAQDPAGAAIDMPAGPSEVLVIADAAAEPVFVASDLLSQAEHGPDSQVLLITDQPQLPAAVGRAIEQQLSELGRAETAREALRHARLIVTEDLSTAVQVANRYAPEHLIINTANARELVAQVTAAGSVFVGPWSPESAGDYCSGTNHVLPTNGYARAYSGVSVASFQTTMTVQELTAEGLRRLGPTVETLANAEGLDAHRQAISLRLGKL